MDRKSTRPFKLRNKTIEDLKNGLVELKKELNGLKISQVSSGIASKLAKIKIVRRQIARFLTVINEKRRDEIKKSLSTRKGRK